MNNGFSYLIIYKEEIIIIKKKLYINFCFKIYITIQLTLQSLTTYTNKKFYTPLLNSVTSLGSL